MLRLSPLFLLCLVLAARPLSAQEPDSGPNSGDSKPGSLAGSGFQSAAAWLKEAVQHLEQRQYPAAVQAVGTYLLLYPQHYRVPEANFYRAIANYHLGQVQEARNALNALLAADPSEARRLGVFFWLGLTSYRLGEKDLAYDTWLRQLAVGEPSAADYRQQTYLGLAQITDERGEYPAALSYYRLLEGRTKRRGGFSYGNLALRQGLYREAYNAFSAYVIQQEVGDGPSRAQALFYQGQAAFFAGLLPQAKQSLDTFLRLYNNKERLFLAALLMRLSIALEEKDRATAQRFYDEAAALERRYRHGMEDWLNEVELPLFILQENYPLALRHMRLKLARSRGRVGREIARFNVALARAFIDVRQSVRQLQRLKKSLLPDIRERALFQAARLNVSFPLTRSGGLAEMESYLKTYPEGVYAQEAFRILLAVYRSDPNRFWLQASLLLESQIESPAGKETWSPEERSRFYLYWAEMARQLNNSSAALKYLYQSWKLAPRKLVGLQAYYRSGAIYFAQKQYSRALGYFREVQNQLKGPFPSRAEQAEAEELRFYAELAIAQSYAGAGQKRLALKQFRQLIQNSRTREIRQAQLQLGLVYFYQGAYQQAVDTFDAIIAQGVFPGNQPDIPPDQYPPALMALYWKGETLFRLGLFSAARQSFRRASEVYPEALGPSAYLRAALAAKAGEDYPSVVDDLEQAQALAAGSELLQLLNIDFNLVKYNLLLGNDEAAAEAGEHMLKAAPPAYNFLSEAFLEVAELYFNRGDLNRSKAILSLLEKQFIRKLGMRESNERKRLELYLEDQGPVFANKGVMMDNALNASLNEQLYSFDAQKFLQRYSAPPPLPNGSNAAALDRNIHFYMQNNESERISSSIFSALYLQGIIHVEEEDFLAAARYFLQYLRREPLGPYAISALNSILRLLPTLDNPRHIYAQIKAARLSDALEAALFVRYWSLQKDNETKKRALEKIVRQTLSVNARKEALYHLAQYYRKQGNTEQARQLLLELRSAKGGNLALDPENYWAGLANLELGRTAYREGREKDAKVFFLSIATQAQVERETLAEALYWLNSIAHFQGNDGEALRYRESLRNVAPDSEWLRKLTQEN
ncbi:MAG: tetratricopeptide repeat protein [Spirochaetota bacterium]